MAKADEVGRTQTRTYGTFEKNRRILLLAHAVLALRTKTQGKVACTAIKPHHMRAIESYRNFVGKNKGNEA